MPDVVLLELFKSLHIKLSIKVPLLSDNLVGNVILGKKLYDVSISRYSLNIVFSFILSKSILKSPPLNTSHLH